MSLEPGEYDTGTSMGTATLPGPPRHWSYSALVDFEECPARYQMTRADYPQVWVGKGFPPKPTIASLVGLTTHAGMAMIVRAWVDAGYPPVMSAAFVEILRGLGGFTAVLERAAALVLGELADNPRFSPEHRTRLAAQLDESLPRCRVTIQSLLARLDIPNAIAAEVTPTPPPEHQGVGSRGRASIGAHVEYTLMTEEPRVSGRVDLLHVAQDAADIVDYKTGTRSASHAEQLRLYAALWHLDRVSNPADIPVRRLAAAYPDDDTECPVPSGDDMSTLVADITRRVSIADAALLAPRPAEAHPGAHCEVCPVKGICDHFWKAAFDAPCGAPGTWSNLEGTLGPIHASRSRQFTTVRGAPVLLRTPSAPMPDLPDGTRLRLMGVLMDADPDDNTTIAVVASSTEIIILHDLAPTSE